MCGIFAYIGEKDNAAQTVLEGLKTLEYRGYDSWGIAVADNNSIKVDKHIGKNVKIDFMSIDVEGLEYEVLSSNNWSKFSVALEALS